MVYFTFLRPTFLTAEPSYVHDSLRKYTQLEFECLFSIDCGKADAFLISGIKHVLYIRMYIVR